MNANRLVFFLAFLAAGSAGCGGSPTRPDGNGQHDVTPPGTVTFRGTVKLGSAGLAGVQVALSGDASRSAVTNSQGVFSFADIAGNSFVVTPSFDGYSFTPPTYSLGSMPRMDLDFAATSTRALTVGDTAQDFTGPDQSGQVISLYSYRGKVVLINVSAGWCEPCRHDAPGLEALYQQYKDRGLQVLTILIDGSAAEWASSYKLTFPVVDDKSKTLYQPFSTGMFPTLVILDRAMVVRFKNAGHADSVQMLAVLKQQL